MLDYTVRCHKNSAQIYSLDIVLEAPNIRATHTYTCQFSRHFDVCTMYGYFAVLIIARMLNMCFKCVEWERYGTSNTVRLCVCVHCAPLNCLSYYSQHKASPTSMYQMKCMNNFSVFLPYFLFSTERFRWMNIFSDHFKSRISWLYILIRIVHNTQKWTGNFILKAYFSTTLQLTKVYLVIFVSLVCYIYWIHTTQILCFFFIIKRRKYFSCKLFLSG